MASKDLTVTRLRELTHYDPETGIFRWRVNRNNNAKKGDVLGKFSVSPDGYKTTMIDRKTQLQHRLAWLYVYGEWPINKIDHINRIKTDNRIRNLRCVTNDQNMQNMVKKSNNTSGYKGVHLVTTTGRWRAQLRVNGKRIDLGTYDTAKQAGDAYIAGVKKFCTHHPF